MRAKRHCLRSAVAGKIDGDDPAAGRTQYLDRQNAYQPHTDHRHRFSKGDVRLAYALYGDRADGCQGRSLEAYICGNADREICGDKVDLAVAGIAGARASDPVARLKPGYAGTCLQHKARAGVAQCGQCLQARLHFLAGGRKAIRLRVFEHLLHQVRARHRFPYQRFSAGLDCCLLRAGADRRKSRTHENASPLKLGSRHIISCYLPRFHILEQRAHLMPLGERMELWGEMGVTLAA